MHDLKKQHLPADAHPWTNMLGMRDRGLRPLRALLRGWLGTVARWRANRVAKPIHPMPTPQIAQEH